MERRIVIKQIMIMAAGMALLPSCLREEGQASIALQNMPISLVEEKVLAEITETLIPATDSPGAKALNLHLAVLKMLDDCYTKAEQDEFKKGLGKVDELSQALFSQRFSDLPRNQRENLLTDIQEQRHDSPSIAAFYKIMKAETIKGYLNSKYVMTKLVIWELVPGRYNGYYPVKTT
jgi:hypothetical protein